MVESISITKAAKALGLNRVTVYLHCKKGLLPAEQVGVRGDYHINPADLREFAKRYNYPLSLAGGEPPAVR